MLTCQESEAEAEENDASVQLDHEVNTLQCIITRR